MSAPRDPAIDEITEAYRAGNLVLVVGPGLSTAAGLPSRRSLGELLLVRARGRDSDERGLTEIERLIERDRIAEGLSAAKELLGENDFRAAVERLLDDQSREVPELGKVIATIASGFRAMLTTNIDRLLERALEGRWPSLSRATAGQAQRRQQIIKLHGTLVEPATWILTQDDFERVRVTSVDLQRSLSAIFDACTVLVIGYSVDDEELWEVLRRIRALPQIDAPRHFALVSDQSSGSHWGRRLERSGIRIIRCEDDAGVADILREIGSNPGAQNTGAEVQDHPPETPPNDFLDRILRVCHMREEGEEAHDRDRPPHGAGAVPRVRRDLRSRPARAHRVVRPGGFGRDRHPGALEDLPQGRPCALPAR